MSQTNEAVRAVALSEAVKHHGDSAEPSIIVKTAATFLAFLAGDAPTANRSTAGAEPSKPVKPALDAKAAAKAAAKAKAEEAAAAEALKKANAEAEGDEEGGEDAPTDAFDPTDEASVAGIVGALIKAEKRQDAINLLKKYKAKSQSELVAKGEATIAKFVSDGNALLGLESEPSLD